MSHRGHAPNRDRTALALGHELAPERRFLGRSEQRLRRRLLALFLLCSWLVCGALWSQTQSLTVSRKKVTPDPEQENRLPRPLRDLGWDQQMGAELPLDATFVDQDGKTVRLRDYFGERPVLIAPVYYECPMLCSLVLDGVVRGVKPLKFVPGEEFEILAVSFDARETPKSAERSLKTALARYGRDSEARAGWNFLTGDQQNITRLMSAIGFKYEWDQKNEQFAHAGGVVVATPTGQISRYFYGVDFATKDLRLGFVEASRNEIGNVVDQVLLFCYQYDPAIGEYSAMTLRMVRVAGVLTVLILGGWVFLMFRRERNRREHAPAV